MGDVMLFPDTVEEFMEDYKLVDTEHVYSNGIEFVPIFRMRQWFEHTKSVRRGHWETIEGWDGDELYRCSECGAEFVLIDGTPNDNEYWYCPHCGARMDEGREK